MNLLHRWICSSAGWKQRLEAQILPWALEGVNLGADVLEIGPGFGATTGLLCGRVSRLTCVEVDPVLAGHLRRRAPANVRVLCEDAAALSLPDGSFDGAVCFTMLHHVPSVSQQDALLAQVARVLRPGAMFAGTDSVYSRAFAVLHWFDTMVVVDPRTFPRRLEAAGFEQVHVDATQRAFRFRARKR